jgi:hypothetical protein
VTETGTVLLEEFGQKSLFVISFIRFILACFLCLRGDTHLHLQVACEIHE